MESIKNVSGKKLGEMLKNNEISHHDIVAFVAELFIDHYGEEFKLKYGFELNRLLVSESIQSHHAQLSPNVELGLYTLHLLKFSQEDKLTLSFNDQSTISSLLFQQKNN